MSLVILENICVSSIDGGLDYAYENYRCSCPQSCVNRMNWIGWVHLTESSDCTSNVLTALGVNPLRHFGIKETINNLAQDEGNCIAYLTGHFHKIAQITIDIRYLRAIIKKITYYLCPRNEVDL